MGKAIPRGVGVVWAPWIEICQLVAMVFVRVAAWWEGSGVREPLKYVKFMQSSICRDCHYE